MDKHFHDTQGGSNSTLEDARDREELVRSSGEVSGRRVKRQHATQSDVSRDADNRSPSEMAGINTQSPCEHTEYDIPEQAAICEPCLSEGTLVEAQAYCQNCNEHLCKTCIRFHKKFSATSTHKVYDLEIIKGDIGPPELPSINRNMEALHLDQYTKTRRSRLFDMVPTNSVDIFVKAADDKYDCNITGLALFSSDNIVLCDNVNRAVKLLAVTSHRIIAQYRLQSNPWGVTVTEDQLVAVSLPFHKRIQLFSVRNAAFVSIGNLKADGVCLGLAYINGKLIVSCDGGKVEILSTNGIVHRTFRMSADSTPRTALPEPWYMTASSGQECVYVSYRATNEISRILMSEGQYSRCTKHKDISYPAGLTMVNDTELVLCCWDTHAVQLFNIARWSEGRNLLNEEDGLKHPQAVCYSEEDKKLFVSSYWYNGDPKYLNSIKMFQFMHMVRAPALYS